LKHSKVDASKLDIKKLAEYDINGRIIKNVINITRSYSETTKTPITNELIDTIIHSDKNL
jgi:hypothetical protein